MAVRDGEEGQARLVTMQELIPEFVSDAERRHAEYRERQANPPPPSPAPKVYRSHYCTKKHRSYRTMAECIWHWAAWVSDEGPYALLAHCRDLTITLHSTLESAQASRAVIDASGCGGACCGKHEIIRLTPPDQATSMPRRQVTAKKRSR